MIFCWVVFDLNMVMLIIMMITVDVHQKCKHFGLGLGLVVVFPLLVLTTSLLKWLSTGSCKQQHTIAHGRVSWCWKFRQISNGVTLTQALNAGGRGFTLYLTSAPPNVLAGGEGNIPFHTTYPSRPFKLRSSAFWALPFLWTPTMLGNPPSGDPKLLQTCDCPGSRVSRVSKVRVRVGIRINVIIRVSLVLAIQ